MAASAQFSGGIKAGGNYTNVVGDGVGHEYVPGWHVGAFGEYEVSQLLSVQAEIVYSVKGFRAKYSKATPNPLGTLVEDWDVPCKFTYVDVPLMLNIHFGSMGSYIGLGPQLSFLMSAGSDGKLTSTTTFTGPPASSKSTDVTIADSDTKGYSGTDFSFVLGTGAKWDSGIEYCIRAGYGLTNMIDQTIPPTATSFLWYHKAESWHNLVFTVSLGYAFGKQGGGGGGGGDRYGHKYNSRTKHR